MDTNDRHPSEQSDDENVRIIQREDAEIDLRDESASRVMHRSPWPSMSSRSTETSGSDPVAHFPISSNQTPSTPFLRPLRPVADEHAHEFEEIDLREHDAIASNRTGDDAHEIDQSSHDKIPPVLAQFDDTPQDESRHTQQWSFDDIENSHGENRETLTEPSESETSSVQEPGRRGWIKKSSQKRNEGRGKPFDESLSQNTDVPTAEQFQKSSLTTRVVTGLVAAALAVVAFANGPVWLMALAVVILVGAAMEYFDGVRAAGFRPATALGIVTVVGLVLGAYARGETAIPIVLSIAVIFTFLWFISGIVKASPTANIAVTLLGITWIGVFGSFAALLLREPNRHGVAFLGGAVLVVVAYDTAAYLGGSLFGRRKLAPSVSPSKTVEGAIIGTIAACLMGLIGLPFVHPWGVLDGLLFGIAVAVVAPIGDLAESVIKRDIGVKDMGRILPGHGGILDRFDAFLMVLPVTYFMAVALDLLQ